MFKVYNAGSFFNEQPGLSDFFKNIIGSCPMGILIFDKNMSLIASNDYLLGLIGKKKIANSGSRFCDVFICDSNDDFENCKTCPIIKNVRRVSESGESINNIEVFHNFIKNNRKDVMWFNLNANNHTFNGEIYTVAVLANITKQKYLESNLKNLGITDGHTLLYYRKFIIEQLEILASDPGVVNHPLSIVMIDIDNLNGINERHGIHVGDEIIRELAIIITHTIRHTDFAGRYGGEEFLLLLPDTNKEGAAVLTERIMSILSKKRFGEMTIPVSFSAGILEINHPDINIDNFLINTRILLLRNKEDRKTGWYSASMEDFE